MKTPKKQELIVDGFSLSVKNVEKIKYYAAKETRGNKSAWLDGMLTKIFADKEGVTIYANRPIR